MSDRSRAGEDIPLDVAREIQNAGVNSVLLDCDGQIRKVVGNNFVDASVYLPFNPKDAGILEMVHLPTLLKVMDGVAEEDLDKCQSWLESLSVPHASDVICVAANNECVYETMNNFNDYDDYVFDVVSALGASAFECVEEEGDAPSVIVSVASPYDFPLQTLSAFGVKAKDEKEAIKKLKTLFAL